MDERRITVDPLKMQGLPCIRDTRITVSAVLGQLAAGQSVEQVLSDYPDLDREDVYALHVRDVGLRTASDPQSTSRPRATAASEAD